MMNKSSMMSSQIDSKLVNRLCDNPIINKIKMNRGLQTIRKMSKVCEQLELESGETLQNHNKGNFLIIVLKGQLQIQRNIPRPNSSQNISQNYLIKQNEHYLIDVHTISYKAVKLSEICIFRQKYILQYFEGIIDLPYLNQRLKTLKKNQIFKDVDRKTLNKIVFELEELVLSIGSTIKIFQHTKESKQINKYLYYIVTGQIKVCRKNESKRGICTLGSNQVYGDFKECCMQINQQNFNNEQDCIRNLEYHYGIIITSTAQLYKIKAQFLDQNFAVHVEYQNKRQRWREGRLKIMNQKIRQVKSKENKSTQNKKGSFIEKQLALRSFYRKNQTEMAKMKQKSNKQELQCQNRQQYYSKKLDKIKNLQKQRYGQTMDTVLFPIKLERRFQVRDRKLSKKSNYIEKAKQSINIDQHIISKSISNSRKLVTQPTLSCETSYHVSLRNSRKIKF